MASRLAKADPNLEILLIEGGINNRNIPSVIEPALFLTNLKPDSTTVKFYKSTPSTQLNGRELVVPTGGCLGGGGSVNFMVYLRANGVDFDDWNTEGWTFKDMLPCINKVCQLNN